MYEWLRKFWQFLKNNLITVLLGAIALLLLADYSVRIGYTQLSGEQFNNWVTPFISLIGFAAIVYGIFITRKDILNRTSQPFYEDHLKVINELVDGESALKNKELLHFLQTDSRFMNRNIDLIKFSLAYLNLYGILVFDYYITKVSQLNKMLKINKIS